MTRTRSMLLLAALLAMCLATPAWSQSVDQPTIYYSHAVRGWRTIPSISIAGSPDDPRAALVVRAVEFWNSHLELIGSPFRLGSITYTSDTLPDDFLQQRSVGVLDGAAAPPAPETLANMPGDIVVALSGAEFVSFSTRVGSKALVAIRNGNSYPLALPNVALNVITHELGHAIGLGHNNNPALLMCGRPATCRPDAFVLDGEHIFPITGVEEGFLMDLYPPTWAPQ
jgi:hypothetical protein